MLGSTSATNAPSTGARAKSARPAAASSSPLASGTLMPKRRTSFADRPSESTAMITLRRQEARGRPAAGCSRARAGGRGAERKNHANIAAAHRTPTTLAVEMFRRRKRPSGTSGAGVLASMHDKRCEEQAGDGQQPERPGGRPADLVAVHDRVDREHQRCGDGDRPAPSSRREAGAMLGSGQHEPRERRRP